MSVGTETGVDYDRGSFRDPSNRVFYARGSVFRALDAAATDTWRRLAASQFFRHQVAAGRVIATEEADLGVLGRAVSASDWTLVLRHEGVPFLSYPYEWSFSMLRDAALCQLELLNAAVDAGFTLKDGSAFNVQWRGARPVFIDVGSLDVLTGGRAWDGYRQFCRTQLYPLMLQAWKGVAFQPFLRGRIEGILPSEAAALMTWRDLLRPGVLVHVVLQHWLQSRTRDGVEDEASGSVDSHVQAAVVRQVAHRLERIVRGLRWTPPATAWSTYPRELPYTREALDAKRQFVSRVAARRRWPLVWDFGCNDGRFSRLVADRADCVVAMDADHAAIDALYQALKVDGPGNILPLVIDLVDPPPPLGWRGGEREGFFSRGRPDLLLCLALFHHLVLTAGVPLEEVVDWLSSFGAPVMLEFATPDDEMVRRLLRRPRRVSQRYDQQALDEALARRFLVEERHVIPGGTRILHFLRPLGN